MDKRTIIALILIFGIFWLSNELIWKRKAPEEPAARAVETVERDEPEPEWEIPEREAPERAVVDLSDEDSEIFDTSDVLLNNNIRLENDLMAVIFSNQGAVLHSVLLQEYFHYDKINLVNLIPENEFLLGMEIQTAEDLLSLDDLRFNWEKADRKSVTFYLENQDQRLIEKRYSIDDEYALIKEVFITGLGEIRNYRISMSSGIAETEESIKHKGSDYRFIGQIQNARRNIQLRRMDEAEIIRGSVDWASVRSKYFIMALIPEERIITDETKVFSHQESPAFELSVRPARATMQVNDSYELYLGPLDYNHLQRYGIGLEETIDMGWRFIRPLGRFFLWLLTNMNKVFGNYGITIIFFALLLKIILYPLTHKSFSSTHKMQKVQPYMQEIQRKYKSDPKQMQAELQKLYKEHGVNPLGGCFPLLLQMPIFFALYPVLRYSIELRQASFVFWLTDLSEPDPYIILPILMGIFMFVQQRMMMSKKNVDKEKMDEKQLAQMQSQKLMMYIMPVFLVFIFRTLPSGLVLYWTVFNVFSIIQQYFIVKKFNR